MARRTAKYVAGLAMVRTLPSGKWSGSLEHEDVYADLEAAGYNWDNKSGTWAVDNPYQGSIFEDYQGNATGQFKLRVMAHHDHVLPFAERLVGVLRAAGMHAYVDSGEHKNRGGAGSRVYVAGEFRPERARR